MRTRAHGALLLRFVVGTRCREPLIARSRLANVTRWLRRSRPPSSRASNWPFGARPSKLQRLALVAVAGVAAIALLLRRGGFDEADTVFTILLLAPPAFLYFFTRGILELVSLPDRLRRVPGEGQERVAELTACRRRRGRRACATCRS